MFTFYEAIIALATAANLGTMFTAITSNRRHRRQDDQRDLVRHQGRMFDHRLAVICNNLHLCEYRGDWVGVEAWLVQLEELDPEQAAQVHERAAAAMVNVVMPGRRDNPEPATKVAS